MKSLSSRGITVLQKKGKNTKRTVFGEKIFRLPRPLRFLQRVAVHTFQLPDGSEGQWESIHVKVNTVLVAALTPAGKLILVEQFRIPMGGDCLELPGGDAKKKREAYMSTAWRELLEEAGYSSKEPLIYLCGGPLCSGGTNGKYIIFAALNCRKTKKQNLDPVEQFAGLRVVKKSPSEIWGEIGQGNNNLDPLLATAILALHAKGLIAL